MPRIDWNKPGERFFETGVSNGVLYPRGGAGVPWNGLISVSENASGGDITSLYYDGVKYLDLAAAEDFQAVLEAFSAPVEFGPSDGQKYLSPGLSVTQQPRKPFDLCYRTLIGNDLVGTEYAYKLHLVYNCTAAPSGRSNKTLSESVEPGVRSWTIDSVPPPATTFKPTAHLVIDSSLITRAKMDSVESFLYGADAAPPSLDVVPRMLTIAEVVAILGAP